jgi:hypothetical protein
MEASMQAAGESSPLAHFRQIFQLLRLSSSGTGAKHTMLANNVNLTIFRAGSSHNLHGGEKARAREAP